MIACVAIDPADLDTNSDKNPLSVRKLELTLAFAASLLLGAFTTSLVLGQSQAKWQIPIAKIAFFADEDSPSENHHPEADLLPAEIEPIIAQQPPVPALVAQLYPLSAPAIPIGRMSTDALPRTAFSMEVTGTNLDLHPVPAGLLATDSDKSEAPIPLTINAAVDASTLSTVLPDQNWNPSHPVSSWANEEPVPGSQLWIADALDSNLNSDGNSHAARDQHSSATNIDAEPISSSVSDRRPFVAARPSVKSNAAHELDSFLNEIEGKPVPDTKSKARAAAVIDAVVDEDREATIPFQHRRVSPLARQQAPQAPAQPRMVPPEPRVMITRQMASLRPRIAKTLRFYSDRPLNTKDDSAWSVMHSILGYGVQGMVAVNGKKGRRTNAVNWMCWNNPCANRRLLYLENGYIKGREGAGFQGHPGQFLAMLAQINLKRDFPLRVQGQVFKIEDLINSEMYTCSSKRELTFKLIALSHYLHSDAQWTNEDGEVWDIPKILELELSQPVNGAACGGTHRVMAISYAVRTKERRGEPLDAVYLRAKDYVRRYQRYAMSLQNRDGSFSSDWFKRLSDWGDKDRQLQTTGHLLEWLVYSLPRNELSDARIVRSVSFLNHLMSRHRYHDWEVGPRGHALRALSLYHQRVFERQRAATPIAIRGTINR